MPDQASTPAWWTILQAARELEDFSAQDLAARAGLRDGSSATSSQIASAWLGKLQKWGYVEVVGTIPVGQGRPRNVWRLTPKGKTADLELGDRQKLLFAIRAFQAAYATSSQSRAAKALFAAADQVDAEFQAKRNS